MKTFTMRSSNAFNISRTSYNFPTQDLGEIEANLRLVLVTSNLVLHMHKFSLVGAPSRVLIFFVKEKYLLPFPGRSLSSNHTPTKIKISPKDISLIEPFDSSGGTVSSARCVGDNRRKCERSSLLHGAFN